MVSLNKIIYYLILYYILYSCNQAFRADRFNEKLNETVSFDEGFAEMILNSIEPYETENDNPEVQKVYNIII